MTGPSATARGGSKVQQVAVAGRLKAHQDALARSVRKMGGTVEAKYQYAYNGIKVRLPSRKIAALATQPGVKAIHPVATYTVDNRRSVPFIGAPAVWQDFGDTGSGQTIAVIDTGIDYTHANFGGAGTEAAYDDNDSTVIEPGIFPTAKVIDGWDFVGDAYNPGTRTGPRSGARPRSARLQRPRLARRRHGRRVRRQVRPHDLHRPVQLSRPTRRRSASARAWRPRPSSSR